MRRKFVAKGIDRSFNLGSITRLTGIHDIKSDTQPLHLTKPFYEIFNFNWKFNKQTLDDFDNIIVHKVAHNAPKRIEKLASDTK